MTLNSPGHNPLDPTSGDEMAKTRPCVIIGVDSMRRLSLRVVIPYQAIAAFAVALGGVA